MRKVPREVLDLVSAELGRFPGLFIGGSYVRGKPTSGDMDIVIRHNSWDALRAAKFNGILIREPFAFGEHKIGTMITLDIPSQLYDKVREFLEPYNYFRDGKINIKVDFFLAKPEEYLTTKLFAIGSGNFNIIMRTRAKKRGYLLNNEGLFKNGKRIPVKNEKEIFELLGMNYREPEQRL
jgi:DNA polymerase/3'-5' exonuclease PolX